MSTINQQKLCTEHFNLARELPTASIEIVKTNKLE